MEIDKEIDRILNVWRNTIIRNTRDTYADSFKDIPLPRLPAEVREEIKTLCIAHFKEQCFGPEDLEDNN